MNQTRSSGNSEHGARGQRQIPCALRELFEEVGIRGERAEGVLHRGAGVEAAVRIDRVIALIPVERRCETGDLDIGDRAVAGQKRVLGLVADVAGLFDNAVGKAVLVTQGPAGLPAVAVGVAGDDPVRVGAVEVEAVGRGELVDVEQAGPFAAAPFPVDHAAAECLGVLSDLRRVADVVEDDHHVGLPPR